MRHPIRSASIIEALPGKQKQTPDHPPFVSRPRSPLLPLRPTFQPGPTIIPCSGSKVTTPGSLDLSRNWGYTSFPSVTDRGQSCGERRVSSPVYERQEDQCFVEKNCRSTTFEDNGGRVNKVDTLRVTTVTPRYTFCAR